MIRVAIYFLYGLVVLFLFRLVMRSIVRVFGGRDNLERGPGARTSGSRAPEDLVRDPVCNTYVPRSRALPALVQGREELFCSRECRDRALSTAPRAS